MKLLIMISFLSLISTSISAPSLFHAKRQAEQLAETGESSTQSLIDGFKQWHIHLNDTKKFVDDTALKMTTNRNERDYSRIALDVQRIRDDINAEPGLLNTLSNVLNLGPDNERAVANLRSNLISSTGGAKLEIILFRIEFNAQAPFKSDNELKDLSQEQREQQPDYLLEDQLKELNGIRCCDVLPAIETLFYSVATGSGVADLVDLTVPIPDVCKDSAVCTKQLRRGNPAYTEGYRYVIEPNLESTSTLNPSI